MFTQLCRVCSAFLAALPGVAVVIGLLLSVPPVFVGPCIGGSCCTCDELTPCGGTAPCLAPTYTNCNICPCTDQVQGWTCGITGQ